ncbi:glycosyltransferase family 4 protein [Thermomonospora umbrina]|uniref:Glycosyltransferase involved in cell wall biosynthesis n=1 Tax=Thermomonospora umbrina TaxID=111806 RepID=A0A3D9SWQ6_9ACTN|nr:glycosyltransferase family 4 protein [Thermomonospora umbrina]REE97435.1 glycosyltransferase involved in cell wall biosynthesis [Thermomonospora umbrina]
MHVLRLCSVFEAPATALIGHGVRFDPIGGMQSHTAHLTRALDQRGVRQTVVTTRPPTAPARARFGRHAVVQRYGLPLSVCRQLYAVPVWWRLPELAQGVDLVHAHLGEDLAMVPLAVRVAARARAPLVVTVHCSLRHTLRIVEPRSVLLKTFGAALQHHGLKKADAVIVLTERLKPLVPGDNVHVIPPGVGVGFRRQASVSGRAALADVGRPRVAFVGRLRAQKGVDTLLRAFALLGASGGRLVIVGDGPERARLEALAARLGVAGRVSFLGFVPHETVPALLREMDVLVLPSRYEELGSVLLEAMYCRVPVVATQVGGVPHLIRHGHNGLLVPSGSPARLADTLRRLLVKPGLGEALADEARRSAQDVMWDRLVHRVLDVYGSVLPESALPRPTALRAGRSSG